MPALNPPSMQIGALPMGASTLSPQPGGPLLQFGQSYGLPTLVQQVAGASTSAAPASFTLGGITATKVGTFLVALVNAAQSGAATVSTPSGWTAVAGASGNNAGNTLGGDVFVYPNNPGGITSVVFSTLTGINGIAVHFSEWSNVYAVDRLYVNGVGNPGTASYSNSSTTPAVTQYITTKADPLLLIGFEADVTGQAYTPANIGGPWTAGTTATSTTGLTNTIIRPFWAIATPVPTLYSLGIAGTLAGSIACGAVMLSLTCATTGSNQQPTPEIVLTGAVGGGIGPTKPGGAGGGQ